MFAKFLVFVWSVCVCVCVCEFMDRWHFISTDCTSKQTYANIPNTIIIVTVYFIVYNNAQILCMQSYRAKINSFEGNEVK